MKKLKKAVVILLAISTLLIAVSGCSGTTADNGGTSSPQASQSEPSGTDTPDTADQKVTISATVWFALSEDNNWVEAFMDDHPNITVDVVSVLEENYSQKLNAMVAAGTPADVMLSWECDIPGFARNGAIVPLDAYIDSSETVSADDFIPAMDQLKGIGGSTYGLPYVVASEILYYNKDMFDAADVAYPTDDWTWDDLTAAAQQLTIVENGDTIQYGIDTISFKGIWYSLAGSAGDDIVNTDASMMEMGDGAIAAVNWVNDLVNTYKVMPEPTADNAADLFGTQKAAMVLTGNWMVNTYKDDPTLNFDIALMPFKTRQYTTMHTGLFCIADKSEYKDAAWTFIEWCMSEPGQSMIAQANPTARLSYQDKGWWELPGVNVSWDVLKRSTEIANFGYTLAPPGVTDDFVNRFKTVLTGDKTAEQAVSEGMAEAETVMG